LAQEINDPVENGKVDEILNTLDGLARGSTAQRQGRPAVQARDAGCGGRAVSAQIHPVFCSHTEGEYKRVASINTVSPKSAVVIGPA